jgi:hypothetical protein
MAISYHTIGGTVNGTTYAALGPAPGSGEVIVIKYIHVYNPNGGAATVTFALRTGGVTYPMYQVGLAAGAATGHKVGAIVLEDTSDYLYVAAGASYGTALDITSQYAKDADDLATTFHNGVITISDTTWVELVAAPASGKSKILREAFIDPTSVAGPWIDLALNKNGTRYIIGRFDTSASTAPSPFGVEAAILDDTDESIEARRASGSGADMYVTGHWEYHQA